LLLLFEWRSKPTSDRIYDWGVGAPSFAFEHNGFKVTLAASGYVSFPVVQLLDLQLVGRHERAVDEVVVNPTSVNEIEILPAHIGIFDFGQRITRILLRLWCTNGRDR
jgi:hypothetical protein